MELIVLKWFLLAVMALPLGIFVLIATSAVLYFLVMGIAMGITWLIVIILP